jgi:hypothetical protein
LPGILALRFGVFQVSFDKLLTLHSESACHAVNFFLTVNVGFISRQQLAQVVQSIPAHTRLVVSKTRWSISSDSRLHRIFRNWRNLTFSSAFLSASTRI